MRRRKTILPLVADICRVGVGRRNAEETDASLLYAKRIVVTTTLGLVVGVFFLFCNCFFSTIITHGKACDFFSPLGMNNFYPPPPVCSPSRPWWRGCGCRRVRGRRIAPAAVHRPINSLSGLINARLIIAAASVYAIIQCVRSGGGGSLCAPRARIHGGEKRPSQTAMPYRARTDSYTIIYYYASSLLAAPRTWWVSSRQSAS